MLTRRDVLDQLKIRGVRGLFNLKKECRNLEYHMELYYDLKIFRLGEKKRQRLFAEKKTTPEKSSAK